MPREGWKSIAIREEMKNRIDDLIEERPDLGYASTAQFVADAVRQLMEKVQPRLEHFNTYENRVTLQDNLLDKLVNIIVIPRKNKSQFYFYCEECESTNCVHTRYVVEDIPHKTIQPLQQKGWKYQPKD